jgi:transposase
MQLYAGIDLHSSNNYLGIIDTNDKRVFGKRLPNCIKMIHMALKPFRKNFRDSG